MIHAIIKLSLVPEKRADALGLLSALAERIRVKRGCIACSVCQDVQEEEMIRYEELWESREAMERHLRSDDYRKILLVMEMTSHAPDISFNTIKETAGMETIRRVRREGMV